MYLRKSPSNVIILHNLNDVIYMMEQQWEDNRRYDI